MDSDWAVFVEDNVNNVEDKNIPPLKERTEYNPGSINLFITICDYDEEKQKCNDNDEKYNAFIG